MDDDHKLLAESIWQKMEDDNFGKIGADFQDYLKFFIEICNTNDNVQEEVEGWDLTIQINIEGFGNFSITINSQIINCLKSEATDPDIIIELDASQAAEIFMGYADATEMYKDEQIKITGSLSDTIKFRLLTEIVREELEEYQPALF